MRGSWCWPCLSLLFGIHVDRAHHQLTGRAGRGDRRLVGTRGIEHVRHFFERIDIRAVDVAVRIGERIIRIEHLRVDPVRLGDALDLYPKAALQLIRRLFEDRCEYRAQ